MGFKNRVYSMEHARLKKMVEAFNFSWRNRLRSLHAGEDLKFVQFSDSILMVANGSDNAMFNLLTKAAICMMHEALRRGMERSIYWKAINGGSFAGK